MAAYRELTSAGVTTREAAEVTGVPRSTATRRPRPGPVWAVRSAPANKLTGQTAPQSRNSTAPTQNFGPL